MKQTNHRHWPIILKYKPASIKQMHGILNDAVNLAQNTLLKILNMGSSEL